MKQTTIHTLLLALCLAWATTATAQQGRINAMGHTPNPAYQGNAVSGVLNVSVASGEYLAATNIYPDATGRNFNVYLDFEVFGVVPLGSMAGTQDINFFIGNLSAGNYRINYYDWDGNTFLTSYSFTVFGNAVNGCGNPLLLSCGNTVFGNNASGAYGWDTYYTSSNGVPFFDMTGPEVVHWFTINTSSNVTITAGGFSGDLDLLLMRQCGNTGLIAWSGKPGSQSEQIVLNNLQAGTYFVVLDGYAGTVSNYYLSLNCTGVITCNPLALSQLGVSAVTSNSAVVTASAPSSVYSIQFQYKPSNGSVWTTLGSQTANAIRFSNLLSCQTYEVQCRVSCNNGWSPWSQSLVFATKGCTNTCFNTINLACGQTYNGSTYGLPNNWTFYSGTPNNWVESGGEQRFRITTTAWGNITANIWGMNFDGDVFILNSCDPNTCIAYGEDAATAYNQPPGTYLIVVDGYNNQYGNYSLRVNGSCNGTTPPVNDEPCNAITLTPYWSCTTTFTNNTGATPTLVPAPSFQCENNGSSNDIWFRVQLPLNGRLQVNTLPRTATDMAVAVYSGSSCFNLTYAGCKDDNADGSNMPNLTITGPGGTWVWLRYWGYGGQTGSFDICVNYLNLRVGEAEDPNVIALPSSEITEDRGNNIEDNPAASGEAATTQPELKFFPVPVSDNLNVVFRAEGEEGAAQLQLLDKDGKLLQEVNNLVPTDGTVQQQVDVSALPAGVYIVHAQLGKAVLSSRFVKVD